MICLGRSSLWKDDGLPNLVISFKAKTAFVESEPFRRHLRIDDDEFEKFPIPPGYLASRLIVYYPL